MANGAETILGAIQPAIQSAAPVSNLIQGFQTPALLRRQALQNELTAAQVQAAPLQQQLLGQRVAAGPEQLKALQLQNQQRQAALDALNIPDEPTAKQVALNVAKIKALPTPEQKIDQIDSMIANAKLNRRSTANLDELKAAYLESPETGEQLLDAGISAFRQTGLLTPTEEAVVTSTSENEFNNLIAGFSPEEQAQARRIKVGLEPRAVGSAAITTATTPDLTEKVATSESIIEQRTKFAELTGSSRAKAIDSGFERVQKIDNNIGNIDKAIQAIDDGASTGAVESRFFPTFRRATKELEQVQRELGLDVIGSTTFGALSEGELQLALETALPTGLEPDALREYLSNKKASQRKLRDYYQRQINFLDQGGTIAGFLRAEERRVQEGAAPIEAQAAGSATASQPAQNTFTSSSGISFTVE